MDKGPSPSLIAFKALSLCDDLIATRRRVLAALIEHFNRRNGRCDPSIDRLAVLLGINRRTVFRALNSLVAKGYVIRLRHGGFHHRNQYVPNWLFYAAIVKKWDEQFREAGSARRATEMSSLRRQSGHLASGPSVTQTFSNNLTKPTLESAGPENTSEARKRMAAEHFPIQARRRVLVPSSRDASRDAAERRWNLELQQFLKGDKHLTAVAVDMMTPELMKSVTDAELVSRGSGLPIVLAELRRAQGQGGQQ
jgi:predicted transcriptional regulator